MVQGYAHDAVAKEKLVQLAVNSSVGKYTLQKGLIRHKGRIWIGNNSKVQNDILHALHASAVGGHSGFHATYNRIKHLFSWPGLKMQVKNFVAACSICQRAKTERVAYPGLLEPLEVPKRA